MNASSLDSMSMMDLEISDMSVVFDASSKKQKHAQHIFHKKNGEEEEDDEDDDDDETASTITAESTTTSYSSSACTSSSHRSIFGDYWQKNGGEASRVTLVPISALHIIPPIKERPLTVKNDHPELPFMDSSSSLRNHRKNHSDSTSSASSPRRSIFGAGSTSSASASASSHHLHTTHPASSSPSEYLARLAAQYQPDPLHRKVHSDSLLEARPPSLLRKGRFSSNHGDTTTANRKSYTCSTRRRRSVTFDERVQVREFSKPLERYAMQGWDRHFAV